MSCFSSYAQWTQMPMGTTGNFSSVFFTSPDTGYVVGTGGLYETTDAGATLWKSVDNINSPVGNIPTPATATSIFFANADSGVVVTTEGKYWRTTNKGKTWTEIWLSSLTNWMYVSLNSVFFTDAKNGYTVGGNTGSIYNGDTLKPFLETILKTTDGGITWKSLTGPMKNVLRSVYFTSPTSGYAVGDTGLIIKTTNGGSSWSVLKSGTTQQLLGVSFTSANNGFACGKGGTLLKTIDGGTNWTPVNLNTKWDIYTLSFPNAQTGYAYGNTGGYKTTDGGTTWNSASDGLNTAFDYKSVFFTSTTVGYVVGDLGYDYKTTNGALSSSSVNALEQSNEMFYPNPAGSTLYMKSVSGIATATIYDLQGKVLMSTLITDNHINVANLQPGIFIIRLASHNDITTGKFVKR
jgi:photosystem II stability/assembly factor-like uncharacterized protein